MWISSASLTADWVNQYLDIFTLRAVWAQFSKSVGHLRWVSQFKGVSSLCFDMLYHLTVAVLGFFGALHYILLYNLLVYFEQLYSPTLISAFRFAMIGLKFLGLSLGLNACLALANKLTFHSSCGEELHEQKLAHLFSDICYDCVIKPVNHAPCDNAAVCLCVCVSSQRRPPARPSFACSQECVSSSEIPSPTRALWRSRPRKSYQVQTCSPIGHCSCTMGTLWLTRLESFFKLDKPVLYITTQVCESPCDNGFISCMGQFFFHVISNKQPNFRFTKGLSDESNHIYVLYEHLCLSK